MLRGLFGAILFLLLALPSWATTTVTGHISDMSGAASTSNTFVRFVLRGCAGNQPIVSGVTIFAPTQGSTWYKDFAADGSGNVSGTIYSTRDSTGLLGGEISCGGSTTAVWFGMSVWQGGKSGPEIPVHAKNSTTLDVTQVTPITTNPVATSPTGDTTYLRLDAGNSPLTGNLSSNGTISDIGGTHNGPETFKTVNGAAIVFADQYANVQAAITACATNGCKVFADAAGVNLNLGTLDPGTKAVTLYLGPYTYTLTQLVLRSSLHVYGAGDGQSVGSGPMTVLQSCSGCTTTPAIVLGSGTPPFPVQGVILEGFRLYAAPANTTQIGIDIIAGTGGGGMWYSTFRNLCVGACGPGLVSFKGGNIIFDGTLGGSPNGVNQFNDFTSVKSFRSTGGSYAFQAKGQNAQFTFKNCEFDGPGQSDATAPNIWLGDGVAGLSTPLTTFSFDELTCQTSAVCASLNGAWDITFHQTHVEQVSGAFQLTAGATNGNIGIGIDHSYFAVNTGVNAGSGYLVKGVSGTNAVSFSDNYMISTPDAICAGTCANVLNGINNFGFGGNSNNNNPAANIISSTLQVSNIQSNQAAGLVGGNIALSAGFGVGASITNLQSPWSTGQTANFVINVGTGPGANPTVTVTFPAGFNTPVLCTLDQHGGTHAFSLFAHTTVSASNAVFTFAGTPTTGQSLQVVMRCGP